MIEINLLPQEVKTSVRKQGQGFNVSLRDVVFVLHFVFALTACLHIYLALSAVFNTVQLRGLNKKWDSLASDRQAVEAFKKESALVTQDILNTRELLKQRINWPGKLDKLVLSLPSGVWFNELIVTPVEFSLRASVVSLNNTHMSLVKLFIDALKNDTGFSGDFKSIKLDAVGRRVIGGYDVVDFSLNAELK